jgi:1-aminocyclopropane-1-carboxylate deaminase
MEYLAALKNSIRDTIEILPEKKLDVLRLDKLHPLYGGNKYFKLLYNVPPSDAPLITFGGAHSNHIYATAAFCAEKDRHAIGIIRGEAIPSSTLDFAQQQGMELHFVSREEYRCKEGGKTVEALLQKYPNAVVVPEGGANAAGIKGSQLILNEQTAAYDFIFCACGTGATYTGLLSAALPHQKVIGISVLKGENQLIEEVNCWHTSFGFTPIAPIDIQTEIQDSTIIDGYHFGGYAKHTDALLKFKKEIEHENDLPLDYIYTSKLLFAIFDLMRLGKIPKHKSYLMIHSGGLQGNADYEARYNLKLNR